MEYQFLNNIVKIIIIRKNNKNVYFRFKTSDTMDVTTNYLMSDKEVLKLISKNEIALTKMYQKALKKFNNETFYWYLGKKYTVIYDDSVSDITFENDYIIAPNETKLTKFISKRTKELFSDEVNRVKTCFTGIPEFSLRIRKMTTRWGVCNTKLKIITLNSELIKKDVNLLNYVIVHEICHFYYGNHSKKFWLKVSEYYPNYKEARKCLREE